MRRPVDLGENERRAQAILRAKARELATHKAADALCAADGLYWAQNYTKTYDEHAREKDVQVYKPFPRHEYFEVLWHGTLNAVPVTDACLLKSKRLAIPKSREMMTSWLVCAYILWHCQYFERTRAIVQTQKEHKAAALVEYCRTLYLNQPQWMRDLHPLRTRLDKQPANQLELDSRSIVQGIPSGADQVRSYHPTILVLDETAHLTEAQSSYDSANPVCSQIIMVSSAAPGWFGDCCTL